MFKQEEWQAFSNRRLNLIHLKINSLPPKIEELRDKTKRTKDAVIGASESKLDSTVLDPDIYIENYDVSIETGTGEVLLVTLKVTSAK